MNPRMNPFTASIERSKQLALPIASRRKLRCLMLYTEQDWGEQKHAGEWGASGN